MFGIPLIYLKIGASLLLLLAVYGGYKYVTNLQETVIDQRIAISNRDEDISELETTIEDQNRISDVRDVISNEFQEIRRENVDQRNRRETVINNSVTEGGDRPVGPVLRDYFNE